MIYWKIRKLYYKFKKWYCKNIIQEELTDALHPEFGWFWNEDEQGGKLCKEIEELKKNARPRSHPHNPAD